MKPKDQNQHPGGDVAAQSLEFPGLSSIAQEEAAEHAEAEAATVQAAVSEAASMEQDMTGEYLEAVNHAADIICSAFQSAEPVWSNDRKVRLAAALARCDAAYGWGGVGSIVGHPLIGLAFAGVPLAIGTARAIAKDRAEMQALAQGAPDKTAMAPAFKAGDPMGAAAAPEPATAG